MAVALGRSACIKAWVKACDLIKIKICVVFILFYYYIFLSSLIREFCPEQWQLLTSITVNC